MAKAKEKLKEKDEGRRWTLNWTVMKLNSFVFAVGFAISDSMGFHRCSVKIIGSYNHSAVAVVLFRL